MLSSKRAREVIELSDSDTERELHVFASKAPRRNGTHDDPINLSDTDDDFTVEIEQHVRPVQDTGGRPSIRPNVVHRPPRHETPANKMYGPPGRSNDPDFGGYWNDDEVFFDPIDEVDVFQALEEDEDGNLGGIPISHPQLVRCLSRTHVRQPPPTRQEPYNPKLDEDECLSRVLELFPDIAHEYVAELHTEFKGIIEQVLDKIVDEKTYPKECRRKGKEPEKRESSVEAERKRFMQHGRDLARGKMRKAIVEILKDEFPKIPVYYIDRVQSDKTHLYPTYVALVEGQYAPKLPYAPAGPRNIRKIDFASIIEKYGPAAASLEAELAAAKKARTKFEVEYLEDETHRRAEQINVERCIAEGAVAECATCFDESPLNRMIYCNTSIPHYTCFECAATYIASEVGQSRCRLTCPDSSGCSGGFTEVQLRLVPNKDLVEKLLKLQQEQDVRDAGVDDVIECPFCENKQVCPPVDVDFEFRCQNPECNIVSCRKCQKSTHIPLSCEEAAKLQSKDVALEQRHTIEEAMTAALIRNCTRCRKPFIKDFGCNKMTCPSCGNLQCYVCSKTVNDYNHFHKNGGCPLHDNVEERHAQDVKKAEAAARAKVEAENPLVNKEDLEFQLSERVKKDEEAAEARRRRLAVAGGGGHAGFANYAAIFGNEGLDNEAARAAREANLIQQQRALQRNIEAQRMLLRNRHRHNVDPLAERRAAIDDAQILGVDFGARLARLQQHMAEVAAVRNRQRIPPQLEDPPGRAPHIPAVAVRNDAADPYGVLAQANPLIDLDDARVRYDPFNRPLPRGLAQFNHRLPEDNVPAFQLPRYMGGRNPANAPPPQQQDWLPPFAAQHPMRPFAPVNRQQPRPVIPGRQINQNHQIDVQNNYHALFGDNQLAGDRPFDRHGIRDDVLDFDLF